MVSRDLDLVVHGGLLATSSGLWPGSVAIADGRIAVVADSRTRLEGHTVLDASGQWVLPGIVDAHVHLRDPGMTHKEDFASGTKAAARGGVTTVADMPNTLPPTVTAELFESKLLDVAEKAYVDFALWAGGTRPTEFARFADLGAVGVKIYLNRPGQGDQYFDELSVGDDGVLYDIFEQAAGLDVLVAVHLSNPPLEARWRATWRERPFEDLRNEIANESRIDKVEAAQRVLLLAGATGVRLHIVHVPAAALPMVHEAKAEGIRVTAESFLPFMSTDLIGSCGLLGFDRYRRPDEIRALWEALGSGLIDTLATDHAPHTLAEKMRGNDDVTTCPSGYPELETGLPMMIDRVLAGEIGLDRLVRSMAHQPAVLAGIADRKGAIRPGLDGDLVVVDPLADWTIRGDELATKSGWSPFEGRCLRGRIRAVVQRGRVIVRDGEVLAQPGNGSFLAREAPRGPTESLTETRRLGSFAGERWKGRGHAD